MTRRAACAAAIRTVLVNVERVSAARLAAAWDMSSRMASRPSCTFVFMGADRMRKLCRLDNARIVQSRQGLGVVDPYFPIGQAGPEPVRELDKTLSAITQ